MIDIKERIIKAYQDTSYGKLLYGDIPWYQYPQTIFLIISIFISIIISIILYIFLDISLPISILCFSIILNSSIFISISILSPIYKKRIRKKFFVKFDKGNYFQWNITEFRELRTQKLQDALLKNKLLNGNKKDVKLLYSYEQSFSDAAESSNSNLKLLLGGGIFILLVTPIWNNFIDLTLFNQENMTENKELALSLIFSVFILIIVLALIHSSLEKCLNITYWKYKNIERMLNQIRLNLELDNSRN